MNEFVGNVLLTSVICAVLIILILCISPFLKRYTKKWRYIAFILIAIRLMIPIPIFSFANGLMIPVYDGEMQKEFPISNVKNENIDVAHPEINAINGTNEINGISSNNVQNSVNNVSNVRENTDTNMHNNVNFRNENNKSRTNSHEKNVKGQDAEGLLEKSINWDIMYNTAFVIWLAGILFLSTYYIVLYLYYCKNLKRWSSEITEERTLNIFDKVQKELNIKTKIKLRKCKKISTPMILGIVRPTVLLPEESFTDDSLKYIFTHELIHQKNHHMVFKLLFAVARCIHWFNPFVHIMEKKAYKDMELLCDDQVVEELEFCKRIQYNETLLEIAKKESEQKTNSGLFTFGFVQKTSSLKERMKNIMIMDKRKKGYLIIAVVLIAVIMSSCLISCDNNSKVKIKNYDAEESNAAVQWRDAYAEFLKSLYVKSEDTDKSFEYVVRDMDNNGVPELVLLNNEMKVTVYTYITEVKKIGSIDFGTATTQFFYTTEPVYSGIIYCHEGGGLEHYGYLRFENEKITREELWNEDYSGISKELGKNRDKIEEVSDDSTLIEVVKESCKQELDLHFILLNTTDISELKTILSGGNVYWSSKGNVYNGIFSGEELGNEDFIECTAQSEIRGLKTKDNETFYKISLSTTKEVGKEKELIGYFLVDKENIYQLYQGKGEGLSKKEFIENSNCVCSDTGWSTKSADVIHKLEIKGKIAKYTYHNRKVETGFYETIVWQKGRGIISYRRGDGAERDSIGLEYSTTENGGIEKYKDVIAKHTDKEIHKIFVEDFEGNGEESAFALTRKKLNEEEGDYELWFVNGEECTNLVPSIIATSNSDIELLRQDNHIHILFNSVKVRLNNDSKARIYCVKNGKAVKLFSLKGMNLEAIDDILLGDTIQYTQYDPDVKGWMGASYLHYQFYWNNNTKKYEEYAAKKMTQEEFHQLSGSKKILKAIKNGLKEDYSEKYIESKIQWSYINRDNGTIDINLIVPFKNGEKRKLHMTATRKDNKIVDGDYLYLAEGNKETSILKSWEYLEQ